MPPPSVEGINPSNTLGAQETTNPVNNCENKEPLSAKVYCYTQEAQNKKDIGICNNLKNDLAREDCLYNVATFLGDAALCPNIENDKLNCLFFVGSYGLDIDGCISLPPDKVAVTTRSGGKSFVDKTECFKGFFANAKEEVLKSIDPTYCSYVDEKSCLKDLAIVKGDSTLCKDALCVIVVAEKTLNPSTCEAANNYGNYDESIKECKDTIAIKNLNPDDCTTPSCLLNIASELGDISICFRGGTKYCYERAITGAGMGLYDDRGNRFGFDTELTIDDCNTMRQKCPDCDINLYEECVFRTIITQSSITEQDCEILSDEKLKKSCVFQSSG